MVQDPSEPPAEQVGLPGSGDPATLWDDFAPPLRAGAISTDILDFRARVLVIQAARGGYGRATLIPDTVLPVSLVRPRGPLLPGSRLQTHGPAGSGRKAVSSR